VCKSLIANKKNYDVEVKHIGRALVKALAKQCKNWHELEQRLHACEVLLSKQQGKLI
jgi:hypothetical protein